MLTKELIHKVFDHLDINTRVELGLTPRKLKIPKLCRFESVYCNKKKKMYDFAGLAEDPPYWIIRENIEFDYFKTPDIYVFNMGWEPYGMTMYTKTGPSDTTVCYNHIVKHSVKFLSS